MSQEASALLRLVRLEGRDINIVQLSAVWRELGARSAVASSDEWRARHGADLRLLRQRTRAALLRPGTQLGEKALADICHGLAQIGGGREPGLWDALAAAAARPTAGAAPSAPVPPAPLPSPPVAPVVPVAAAPPIRANACGLAAALAAVAFWGSSQDRLARGVLLAGGCVICSMLADDLQLPSEQARALAARAKQWCADNSTAGVLDDVAQFASDTVCLSFMKHRVRRESQHMGDIWEDRQHHTISTTPGPHTPHR
jgi:hypothetical protein